MDDETKQDSKRIDTTSPQHEQPSTMNSKNQNTKKNENNASTGHKIYNKKCPKCNTENNNDAIKCKYCNYKLNNIIKTNLNDNRQQIVCQMLYLIVFMIFWAIVDFLRFVVVC